MPKKSIIWPQVQIPEELMAKILPPRVGSWKGSCSQKGDHEKNGHAYLHVCSRCFESGKKFPNPLKGHRNGPKKTTRALLCSA